MKLNEFNKLSTLTKDHGRKLHFGVRHFFFYTLNNNFDQTSIDIYCNVD